MRVLLDENLPLDLAKSLPGHEVTTVHALGWDGIKNGALLDQAAGRIDAFVTMDANLQFQQRLRGRPFGVVVIHARSNRLADLLPLAGAVSVESDPAVDNDATCRRRGWRWRAGSRPLNFRKVLHSVVAWSLVPVRGFEPRSRG